MAFATADKLYWPSGGYQQHPESRIIDLFMPQVERLSIDEEIVENYFFTFKDKKFDSGLPCIEKMFQITDLLQILTLFEKRDLLENDDFILSRVKIWEKNLRLYFNKIYQIKEKLCIFEKSKNSKKISTRLESNRMIFDIYQDYAVFTMAVNSLLTVHQGLSKHFDSQVEIIDKSQRNVKQAMLLLNQLNKSMFLFFKQRNHVGNIDSIYIVNIPEEESTLGFYIQGQEYRSFPLSRDNLAFDILGPDICIVTENMIPISSSGFLITELMGDSTSFKIRFIEGTKSEHPFAFKELMNIHLDKSWWDIVDIRYKDDHGILKGFLSLPTGSLETKFATLQLLNLIEEKVLDVENALSIEALTYLNESVNESAGMILHENEGNVLALEYYEEELDSIADSDNIEVLRKNILNKISRVKEECTERLLSEYEEEIMREQEAIKSFVNQESVQGRKKKKGKKNKKSTKSIKKTSEKKESLAKKEEQAGQLRGKALERFEAQSSRTKIKTRGMIKIINAISKQYPDGMSAAESRQKGSHRSIDFGSGASFGLVKPHGKKSGTSRSVASKFFNTLVKTVSSLDLKG